VEQPVTRYAQSGEVAIAYQIVGDGPFDLVWVPGSVSNVELIWTNERQAGLFTRIASFCRLILFDKRGTGLSDRIAAVADLETRMDDVRAVMDAAGTERAAVVGTSEGGPMSILFAATYPERTRALVVYGSLPRFTRAPGFPFGPTREESERLDAEDQRRWGTVELARERLGGEASDEEAHAFAARMRQSASPGAVRQLDRMSLEIDVRDVLASVRVPTLVLHRVEDHIPIDGARWMAERIPGARFVELPGGPHMIPQGDWRRVADEIERFVVPLCIAPEPEPEPDSVLATILFTDIVGSTARAAELGDRGWRELLERHHTAVRQQLARFRGTELDTAGDGFFARFAGPARAIRCATAVRDAIAELGLEIRAGPPHRRVRAAGRKGCRHRRLDRCARRRGGRNRGDPGLADGQGPRGRFGDCFRGPGRGVAQRRARRVAAIRGRARLALRG
jgi:pimeloyl-ACP methyl ester carboxylesterase